MPGFFVACAGRAAGRPHFEMGYTALVDGWVLYGNSGEEAVRLDDGSNWLDKQVA